jgi:endonuclease/exonuclease/phosphatase family metal-dependent hydrolase
MHSADLLEPILEVHEATAAGLVGRTALSQIPPVLLPETVRVMSFNVRYPSAEDGPNCWEMRRDLVVEAIRGSRADVIGSQELYRHQAEHITRQLPHLEWFGRSRMGTRDDEHVGIFYRKDRFRLLDWGDFWLSETPELPASASWGNNPPRIVTWGLFQTLAGGRLFRVCNTHLPHRRRDTDARRASAELICDRIEKFSPHAPVFLTGDFNAYDEDGLPTLLEKRGRLKDAWLTSASRFGPESTLHGFGGMQNGPRIDWILYRGKVRAVEAHTLAGANGRYASDHHPVLAVMELG